RQGGGPLRGRGKRDHRDAAGRPGRAAQEVRGAAGAADVAAGRDLDVGLPGQVDLDGRVDRDQRVLGGEYRLVVGVAGVAQLNRLIDGRPFYQGAGGQQETGHGQTPF